MDIEESKVLKRYITTSKTRAMSSARKAFPTYVIDFAKRVRTFPLTFEVYGHKR